MICTDRNAAGRARISRGSSAKWLAMTTVSAAALIVAAASTASAQTPAQTAQAGDIEELVVTATRIVRDGYEAPTPTTVLSAEAISDSAATNITDYIATMPTLTSSTTPRVGNTGSSGGTTGLAALNLRGLGTNRTLVLLDGRRVVPSAAAGTVDVSDFPQSLITRVDVVTGGASASWGSDAVAGVVNFILDSKYVGVKGDVQGGVTTYGDDRNYKFSLTAGTTFAGDRGHFIISGDYASQDGVGIIDPGHTIPLHEQLPRPWYQGWKGYTNPSYTATNGQPNLVIRQGVGMAQAAPGGIITSGPLKNIMFGPGGVPIMAQFTEVSAAVAQSPMWEFMDIGTEGSLDARLRDQHLFTRATYDVTDDISMFVEASYGYAYSLTSCCAAYYLPNTGANGTGLKPNTVIKADNPFIPAAILAQMQANKLTTLVMGSWNADIGPLGTRNYRTTKHATVGINGKFELADKRWSWDAYFETGLGRTTNDSPNQTILDNYGQAIQAVRDPVTGAIRCADTSKGCVPWNIFGIGVNSQAAKNFISGMAHQNQSIRQNAVSVSANGEPFDDWAGPISLALGGEFHTLKAYGAEDALSTVADYFSGNFRAIRGSFHVWEGYAETVIPLAKDAVWAKTLDFNAAVRATDYSVSGYVTTWKTGLNYTPIDDLRLRAVRSRDIRAPSLVDLYSPLKPTTGNISDSALPGNPSEVYTTRVLGNPALVPETADSTILGGVIQPSFFPGFSASFDYYSIKISGAIASFSGQQIVDQCYVQQVQSFCPFIFRVNPTAPAAVNNPITAVNLVPINFQSLITHGYDIEASYRLPLANISDDLDGNLSLHTVWTRVLTQRSLSGLPSVPIAESAGAATPNWRGQLNASYDSEHFRFGITERFISSRKYSNLYIECASGCPASAANGLNGQTINTNHIDSAKYTDLSLTYRFGDKASVSYEAFFSIANVMNADPPVEASINGLNYITNGTSGTLYDTLGRMFHAGMRFKM